jgi:hypothetical protein
MLPEVDKSANNLTDYPTVDILFENLDKDGNGFVSKEEFPQVAADFPSDSEQMTLADLKEWQKSHQTNTDPAPVEVTVVQNTQPSVDRYTKPSAGQPDPSYGALYDLSTTQNNQFVFCEDKSSPDGSEWFDSTGDGCGWYGANSTLTRCGLYAKSHANDDGMDALEACCMCGGGDRNVPSADQSRAVISDVSNTKVFIDATKAVATAIGDVYTAVNAAFLRDQKNGGNFEIADYLTSLKAFGSTLGVVGAALSIALAFLPKPDSAELTAITEGFEQMQTQFNLLSSLVSSTYYGTIEELLANEINRHTAILNSLERDYERVLNYADTGEFYRRCTSSETPEDILEFFYRHTCGVGGKCDMPGITPLAGTSYAQAILDAYEYTAADFEDRVLTPFTEFMTYAMQLQIYCDGHVMATVKEQDPDKYDEDYFRLREVIKEGESCSGEYIHQYFLSEGADATECEQLCLASNSNHGEPCLFFHSIR